MHTRPRKDWETFQKNLKTIIRRDPELIQKRARKDPKESRVSYRGDPQWTQKRFERDAKRESEFRSIPTPVQSEHNPNSIQIQTLL